MAACRAQYDARFKRRAILLAEDIGNPAAARNLDVNESTIRGWRLQRERLFMCAPGRKGSRGPRHGRYLELEQRVADYVIEQRNRLMAVSVELIQFKASDVARQMGIPRTEFKASRRKQADVTGQRLKQLNVPFSRMVFSTMARATETARIIHGHFEHLPLEPCELIREGAPIPPEPPSGAWKPEAKVFFTDGARIEAGFRKYFYRASPSQAEDSHEIIVCHANVIRYWIC
ncbi:serine/threonine-protein phosphatase Pgam5, mitochondrial isoform X1, partial [Ixodes scapularis]